MNIDQLAGIPLREAFWMKRGWTHVENCSAHHEWCERCECLWFMPDGTLTTLPPVESSIEVAMGQLEEFCDSNNATWEVSRYRELKMFFCRIIFSDFSNEFNSDGTAPADAIVKCLIKAMEKV